MHNQKIWRTVVFAGAMLGMPACHHDKAAQTTPANTATPAAPDTPAPATPTETKPAADPAAATPAAPAQGTTQAADPCSGSTDAPPPPPPPSKRPRGGGDRPTGRGFVLS